MFLKGIYAKDYLERLNTHALSQINEHLNRPQTRLVKDNSFELALAFQRGLYINDPTSLQKYAYGISRNDHRSRYAEKVRRKEFNIDAFEKGSTSLPPQTVAEEFIHDGLTLTTKVEKYWENLLNLKNKKSLDFREDLEYHMGIFNTAVSYYLETYGFNLKFVIAQALNGAWESKTYLREILGEEDDDELIESLSFLGDYIEFYEYIKSDGEEPLSVEKYLL